MNQVALWLLMLGIFVCFTAWPIASFVSLRKDRGGQALEWIAGLIFGHVPGQVVIHDSSHRIFRKILGIGLLLIFLGIVIGLISKT